MVNWTIYLESLCNEYKQWSERYTITDVISRQRVEQKTSRLPFKLELKVERVQRQKEESGERLEKTERFGVLEGLRKYAKEHVLLVGRPGSGKSTALIQLLLEEASSCRAMSASDLCGQDACSTIQNINKQQKIPVLIELRYYTTSIVGLIQSFLIQHDLPLGEEEIKKLLLEKQFLLLFDGVNELPSKAASVLTVFRRENAATPMIFTRREGVGDDLDIANKLEMLSLTEPQMRDFVKAYLPENGEQMLRQLGGKLHEFGQTPLLLMMLCLVFDATGNIPSNLGMAFRQFTQQIYEEQLKKNIPIECDLRNWWRELLEHLALRMTQGRETTQLQVAISKQEAVDILTGFLKKKEFHEAPKVAKRWLDDLLKYHLIQRRAEEKIEFRHQLIQEYYTAESLLKQLPHLLRDEYRLKWEHLNYLKWTEPLALMLELVEDEDERQALRIVQLAQEVDLRLGARLAGAVKLELQAQTVGLIAGLEIPSKVKIQILGITRSEKAIPYIQPALFDKDFDVRSQATEALVNIGSKEAVEALQQALNDDDFDICRSAVEALQKISSQAADEALKKALHHKHFGVRMIVVLPIMSSNLKSMFSDSEGWTKGRRFSPSNQIFYDGDDIGNKNDIYYKVANFLEKIGSPTTVEDWKQVLNHEDSDVRCHAVYALGDIGSKAAVEELKLAFKHEDYHVRIDAAYALGNTYALGMIASEAAFEELKLALKHEYSHVRKTSAYVLESIGSEGAVKELKLALNDGDSDVRRSVAFALGKIGDKAALEELKLALNDEDYDVRRKADAASALGNIGTEAAIEALQNALNNDKEPEVRRSAASALGNIDSEAAVMALRNAFNDEDFNVRREAAEGLGKIASPDLIPEFNNILKINTEINWLDTIAAVQERCKFYNYDIYQSPPPPLAQPTDSNVPTHVHNRIINTSGGTYIESNTGTYVQGDYINSTSTSAGD